MLQSKIWVQALLDSEGHISDLVRICTMEQTKPMIQPPSLLGDRYGLDPGQNSEPWLCPPHIARRLKILVLMLSSSIALIQWQAIGGSSWWTLTCFWVSEVGVRWGGGRRGQGSGGGGHSHAPRSAPPARDHQGRAKVRRKEEGRQELPAPSPPPSTVAPRTPTPGRASWWGSRPSVPCHLQPSSRRCLSAFQLSHLLLRKNDVVFCFFLLPGSNWPKILSYRLLSEAATFPVCWRHPCFGGLSFWDHKCTQCPTVLGREWQLGNQGWGEALLKSACSTTLESNLKPSCKHTISDLLRQICICVMFIPWRCMLMKEDGSKVGSPKSGGV